MGRDRHRCSSLGLVGLSGVVYVVIVTRRMRVQTAYKPEFEDWLFHVLLPIAVTPGMQSRTTTLSRPGTTTGIAVLIDIGNTTFREVKLCPNHGHNRKMARFRRAPGWPHSLIDCLRMLAT